MIKNLILLYFENGEVQQKDSRKSKRKNLKLRMKNRTQIIAGICY